MKNHRLTCALLVGCSLLSPSAQAASDVLVYAVGGTGGLGGGIGYHFNEYFTARAELANYSRTTTVTTNTYDIDYDATVKLQTKALYLDYKPFSGTFRFTAGLNASAHQVVGLSSVEDLTIPAPAGTLTATATYGTRPYLGIGWGLARNGFTMGLDLGVEIGTATVALSDNSGGSIPEIDAAFLADEQAAIQTELDKYDLWPVVKISVGYSF